MNSQASVAGPPVPPGPARARLLYVDDDADETLLAPLRDSDDYEVVTRSTTEAALSVLGTERVDCVLSEYTLPDGSGLDLLATVRERRPGLPFLLVTDDGDESVASEAIGAGVTDYLPKSSEVDLCSRVARAITDTDGPRALLDRMTDAFFALDTEWRLTYVNEQACEILGDAMGADLSAEEMRGRVLWESIPDAVDTTFYEQYHRAMDQQVSVSFEAHYEPLATWFDVRVFPSPTGLSVYFRDVTDQKHREQQLAERQRILKDVHQVIADKSTEFAEKVDELLTIGRRAIGAESAALSRVEGEEYIFELVHDDDIDPGDTVPLAATNCERAIIDEETLVLADIESEAPELTEKAGFTEMGTRCYLGTPVWVDGEVYGTFCFYDSEPRAEPFEEWTVTLVELLGNWISYEQERQRRQRELTRERDRLSDFASLVSHDVRNPLNVATGRLEVVDVDGEDEAHVAAAMDALDRIDELIADMLTLAQLGTDALETDWVDIEAIATDAWDTVDTGAASLTVESSARIVADASRLQQLFENLFRNSVEHATPSDGAPTVRVGRLPDGFYVEDDGPGIPADEREAVFESGYTTSDDGTGFGLRIVAEITEAHGGTVSLTDSDSGGARFEMTGLRVSDCEDS